MRKYTHKTRDGSRLARIILTDVNSEMYPVVAVMREVDQEQEYVETYTADLRFNVTHHDHDYDLIEYSPWEDVKVDTKIMVRDGSAADTWVPRYFSHYACGKVHAFVEGRTSWTKLTTDPTMSWDQAKLAE